MRFVNQDELALVPAVLDDDELLQTSRDLAEAARTLQTVSARVAAEVARRSAPELGYAGLAQRLGARTPDKLVQSVTGSSLSGARRLVRVGGIDPTREPWLTPVLGLAVESIDVIRSALGSPTSAVPADVLGGAAQQLADESPHLDLDALAGRARRLRDELDLAAVPLGEEERRAQRFLRLTPLPTGMTRLTGLLDPESAAIIVGAVDAVTAPRRGGPRFVTTEQALPADDRTVGQLVADTLVDLVSVAVHASPTTLFGRAQPAVRVLVSARDLASGEGYGSVEGQSASVSLDTVRRRICSVGVVPLLFDGDGRGIDEGRTQRLHTPRQRRLIAARDGCCIAPGCDRPPSWCEVHHVEPWSEGGRTTVDDGVLLCRFHHMMVHNNGWRVVRSGATYSFVPPETIAVQSAVLDTRSPALRRLLAV